MVSPITLFILKPVLISMPLQPLAETVTVVSETLVDNERVFGSSIRRLIQTSTRGGQQSRPRFGYPLLG